MISFGCDEREQTSSANHPTLTSCLVNYCCRVSAPSRMWTGSRAVQGKSVGLVLILFTTPSLFILVFSHRPVSASRGTIRGCFLVNSGSF